MFFSNILNLHNSLQIFSNNLKCLILILDDFVALLPRSTITVFSSSIIKKCAINTGRLPSTFSCHWRSICSLSGHTNHLQQPFYFLPSFLSFLPSLSCKSIIDIAHHPAADRWSDRSIDRLTRVHLASKLALGSWARRNWEK